MSGSIEKPYVFLWCGRLRWLKTLKSLRFCCDLGGTDVRKYLKNLGFSCDLGARMSESIEKLKVFVTSGTAELSKYCVYQQK